jgi:hypothetical protein
MPSIKIKNYTSTVAPERTIAKIEAALAQAGATHIQKSYDSGAVTALEFAFPVGNSTVLFRLPVDTTAAYHAMNKRPLPMARRVRAIEQAKRTAWRLAEEDVLIQLSKIAMRQVDPVQAFLPYAVRDGRTLYDALKEGNFAGLIAGPKEDQ